MLYNFTAKPTDPQAVKDCLEFKFNWTEYIESMNKATWDTFYKFVGRQKNSDRIKDYIIENTAQRTAWRRKTGMSEIKNKS